MAQFFDLEHTKLQINRYYRFIKITPDSSIPAWFHFTEVDDLEEVIETLQDMLKIWRDGLDLKPVKEHADE